MRAYYVAFNWSAPNGQTGVANTEVSFGGKLTRDRLEAVITMIREKNGYTSVVILNLIPLED